MLRYTHPKLVTGRPKWDAKTQYFSTIFIQANHKQTGIQYTQKVDIATLKRPFKTSKTNFDHGQTKVRQKVAKIDLIPVTGRPEKISEHTQQIAVLQYQMNIMYQV